MAKIAVIHRQLGVGGGESVCFHILEALQDSHNVHIYTLDGADFDELNRAFGTDVDDVTVHIPTAMENALSVTDSGLRTFTGGSVTVDTGLELSALARRYHHEWEKFDLRISTHGELPLTSPAIQYLHHPFLNRWSAGEYYEIERIAGKVLNWIYTRLSGATAKKVRRSRLLTNSSWSAEQIEQIYSIRPQVVYPPITIPDSPLVPWCNRENGFVSIGRVSADKNVHRGIEIVSKLRERGYDVHLHHVGPINFDEPYGKRVQGLTEERDWVSLEGAIPQDQLYELIQTHQWGLHTKPSEHFGMAVAEIVAGGCIPLIHDSGGQIEIVNNNQKVLYSSYDEAVQKSEWLLENPRSALEIRASFPDIETMCGRDTFRESVYKEVNNLLN
jgi:glycosyltransferase involved in cell wall biosynthesis